MNITLFDFCMNFGGASQGSLYLMSRLKAEGFNVSVLDAYGQSDNYEKKSIDYNLYFSIVRPNEKKTFIGHSGYKKLLHTVLYTPSFIKLLYSLYNRLKVIKPDVVIVNNRKSLLLVSLLKKKVGFKVLMYYRGEAIPEQLPYSFSKIVGKNADAIITHSEKAYSNLKKILPKQKNNIYLTQNCIDFREIEKININKDFPTSERFTILLAAGRPVKEKGHDIAIKALSLLKKQGLKVNLIIPGSIPIGHSDSYYVYLKKLINDYSLHDQVKFIGWRSNLLGDLIQCNAIVLPSHTEGFPRSIVEAMLLGIPVCATPVGGIPEAIIHNKTGMLFDIDDVEGLSKCIYSLVHDIKLREDISKNSKEFSVMYFHPNNNTKSVSDLVRKIACN